MCIITLAKNRLQEDQLGGCSHRPDEKFNVGVMNMRRIMESRVFKEAETTGPDD